MSFWCDRTLKELTVRDPSVGADGRQPKRLKTDYSISENDAEFNRFGEVDAEYLDQLVTRHMDPAYLETVSMTQLYDTVFEAKETPVDGLPVLEKLKQIIKNLLLQYFRATDDYLRVNRYNGTLYQENQELASENERLREENGILRKQNKEYSLLWKVFGRNQVERWIQQARETQQKKKRQIPVRCKHTVLRCL